MSHRSGCSRDAHISFTISDRSNYCRSCWSLVPVSLVVSSETNLWRFSKTLPKQRGICSAYRQLMALDVMGLKVSVKVKLFVFRFFLHNATLSVFAHSLLKEVCFPFKTDHVHPCKTRGKRSQETAWVRSVAVVIHSLSPGSRNRKRGVLVGQRKKKLTIEWILAVIQWPIS